MTITIKPYASGEPIEPETVDKTYQPPSAGHAHREAPNPGPIRPPVKPPFKSLPQPLPAPTQQQLSEILQAITNIYPLFKDYAPCRELSVAKTKLDEARLWIIELRNRIHHNQNSTE